MTDGPEEFDLLVVGGGKAGTTLSMDVARSGRRVAIAERGMIGGSRINVACIPTKALVTSAPAARQLRDANLLGLSVEGARCGDGRLPHAPAISSRTRRWKARA